MNWWMNRQAVAWVLAGTAVTSLACAPGGGASTRAVAAESAPPAAVPAPADAPRAAPSPGGEVPPAELEALWGFDRKSDYPTLVQAIGRIQAAIREERDAERARRARMLAVSYLAEEDRVRFQAEFVLEQPEYEHKAAGAKFLVEHLQARRPVDPGLKARIIDRVVADLRAVPGRGAGPNEFVGNATLMLALFGDPRALDIVLTDESTMGRMQRRDSFDLESGPEVFDRLAERYSRDDTEGWLLAHGKLYGMMAARRRSGEPLAPHNPLLDMRKYVELDPVR